MDKSIFDKYIKVNKKIKSLNKYIDKLKKRSEYVADSVQNGYKRRAVIYGVDLKRKNKRSRNAKRHVNCSKYNFKNRNRRFY